MIVVCNFIFEVYCILVRTFTSVQLDTTADHDANDANQRLLSTDGEVHCKMRDSGYLQCVVCLMFNLGFVSIKLLLLEC